MICPIKVMENDIKDHLKEIKSFKDAMKLFEEHREDSYPFTRRIILERALELASTVEECLICNYNDISLGPLGDESLGKALNIAKNKH